MKRIGSRRALNSPPSGIVYDANALAYFTAVTAAGGSFTLAQKTGINNFFVGAKADGWYSKMDRFYINTGGNIASAAIDIITTNPRVAVNSPIYTTTGTSYNGTNSYFRADIQVDQSTKLTVNDGSAGVFWDLNNPPFVNQSILMGARQVNQYLGIQFNSAN